jgi:hypothetical protein
MTRPDEIATVMVTVEDRESYQRVSDRVARIGAGPMANAALRAGTGVRSLILFMAASGATIEVVIARLHLEPGDVADALHTPAAAPVPDEERTVFPDDDDLVSVAATGYAARRELALLDVPGAAQLAGLVPGVRGVVLFCASRDDFIDEVSALLSITPDAVDDIIESGDGLRCVRP